MEEMRARIVLYAELSIGGHCRDRMLWRFHKPRPKADFYQLEAAAVKTANWASKARLN